MSVSDERPFTVDGRFLDEYLTIGYPPLIYGGEKGSKLLDENAFSYWPSIGACPLARHPRASSFLGAPLALQTSPTHARIGAA